MTDRAIPWPYPGTPPPINPHRWRKFKRAEKNMLRFFHRGDIQHCKKWGAIMMPLLNKLFKR